MEHHCSELWQRARPYCHDVKEHVLALYIDNADKVLALCHLGTGTRDTCLIHPRTVFRVAVQLNAASVLLGHTHPSGDATPSMEDQIATEALMRAGMSLRIPLLGHLVLTRQSWQRIMPQP